MELKGLKICLGAFLAALLTTVIPAQKPLLPAGDSALSKGELHELEKISTIVRGQCIDGESGLPLAGCEVEVHAFGRRPGIDSSGKLARPDPVMTGEDGRFAVRVLAHEDFQGSLRVLLDGRWPRTGRWYHFLPGVVEELGQIKLHKGVYARGQVVNSRGQPIPSLSVGIDSLPLYLGVESDRDDQRPLGARLRANYESGTNKFHLHANKVRYGRTGEDGMFKSHDALPPGTFPLSISRSGIELVEPTVITIPEEGPMQPVRITVREELSIQGRVVDESGKPLAGIYVNAELLRDGRSAGAYSRKDGSFQIYRVHDSPEQVRIEIMDPGPCERREPTEHVPWGTDDLEIVLQRALTVPLRVVEAGTDKPVEQYSIRCYPMGGWSSSSMDRDLRLSGEHEDGRLLVDGVRRGPGRLEVIPVDMQLLPVTLDLDATDLMPRIQIEVGRLVPMMIRVLDRGGQPVGNAQVRVITPGNYDGRGGPVVNDPRSEGPRGWSTDPNVTYDTVIYTARTDGGGLCVVYGVDARDDHVLGLRKLGTEDQRVEEVTFGKGHREREVFLVEK